MASKLAGMGVTRTSILHSAQDKCCSWNMAAAVLAVALLALTVVAVMARQGQLPSCTFGGQGGATAVAVASGVLTILACALACCPTTTNPEKTSRKPTPPTTDGETDDVAGAEESDKGAGIGMPPTRAVSMSVASPAAQAPPSSAPGQSDAGTPIVGPHPPAKVPTRTPPPPPNA